MAETLLTVRGLSKRFVPSAPPVVDDVSLSLERGEILVLLGPSGCGKTTTLRMIGGLTRPDAGEIRMAGRCLSTITASRRIELPPERRGIGMVFQDYALFPHLSVLKNVAFGASGPRRERLRVAREMLDRVRMAELADRRPHELSGGQQQRVALARSLAPSPSLILLDEPFSNLDAELRKGLRQEVRALLRETETAAILVTHDQEEALSFADRVVVMRDGRVEQSGRPETVYRQPATAFVATFLGGMNLIRVRADGSTRAASPLGPAPLDRPAEGTVWVAIRPEQLTLEAIAGPAAQTAAATATVGRVVARQFGGFQQLLSVAIGEQILSVRADDRCDYRLGQRVAIRFRDPVVVLPDASSTDTR